MVESSFKNDGSTSLLRGSQWMFSLLTQRLRESKHTTESCDMSTEEDVETEKPVTKTYEQIAKENGMKYTVTDVPPLPTALVLGVQHYLTMLGATVLIPLLITPAMGANLGETAEVISTIFFVSGINTLIQTSIGDRLPIVQGGSFSFLPATFAIIGNRNLVNIEDPSERFRETMQVLQGSIIIVGIVQMVIGYSGLVTPMLRYISPVTIAPVIAAIGLGLYGAGFNNVATCFEIGMVQIILTIIFSQFMRKIKIFGFPVFALFPIILAIIITWSWGAILTAADVWSEGNACRTDASEGLIDETPWIRIPYPGQFGPPKFESYAIVPMLGSMIASMIESIGDYYSCARLAGAPPPTPGIISRGLASEGLGVVIAGCFGTGNGTTSYSENIGALSITGVGSRAVVQVGAIVMIILGIVAKVGAVFASMPSALVGGIYCTVFGLIVAVGLSNLQYVDLNSERNLFIIGFAIFNSLSIAGPGGYFANQADNPFGSSNFADILEAIFSSPMVCALIAAFILDNLVPATREERGLQVWDQVRDADVNNDPEYVKVYSLPLFFAKIFRNCSYLEYASLGRFPDPPANGYQPGTGDVGELCFGSCLGRTPASEKEDDGEELEA